jgi:hypothetical protein
MASKRLDGGAEAAADAADGVGAVPSDPQATRPGRTQAPRPTSARTMEPRTGSDAARALAEDGVGAALP